MPDKPPINLDDFDFGNTIRGHQKGDRVFERFQLRRLLGRGGMGVVWLAMDERLGREVALKFAPESVRYDEVLVDELKEETRKGLDLAHPNIVKIYDFLVDDHNAAISMEFIDGENLGALRVRQPNKVFEVGQMTHWIAQLLDALDYAHRVARVIHRDLKPANLMIDRGGHLRVTDFGIARTISDAMDRATLSGEPSTGTLAYMSPQQAGGRKPSISDDIYALGSTIYELLTGKPPFYSGNIAQQLTNEPAAPLAVRRAEFGIADSLAVPEAWENTVMACLEKDPDARPQSAAQIREMLGLTSASPPAGGVVPPVSGASASSSGLPTHWTASASQASASAHATASAPPVPAAGPPPMQPAASGQATSTAAATRVGTTAKPIDIRKVKVAAAPSPAHAALPPALPTPAPAPAPIPKQSGVSSKLAMGVVAALIAFLGIGGWVAYKHVLPLFVHRPITEKPKPETRDAPPKKAPDVLVQQEPKEQPKTNPKPESEPKQGPMAPPPADPAKPSTIQAAIDRAAPGEVVTVPDGTYEEQLRFKEGIQLKAANPGKVVVQTAGGTGSVLRVEGCASGSISGILFQHTGKDVLENATWPVVLVKSSSVALEECTVQGGVGDGMWLSGAGKPQLRACVFRQNAQNGLVIERGAAPSVDSCEMRKNGTSGIEVRLTGSSPELTNNQCIENGTSGISIKDGARASVSQQNKLTGNLEAGIAVSGEGTSATIQSAVCEGNLSGIFVVAGAKGTVSGCTVKDSKENGILFDKAATGCEVSENTVEKSKFDGLMITGGANQVVKVSGNKSRLNGFNGIVIFGADFKPEVEKNECEKNGQYGVLAAEGVSGVVRDNSTRGNILGGIAQDKAAADLVIGSNQSEEPTK